MKAVFVDNYNDESLIRKYDLILQLSCVVMVFIRVP